MKKYESVERLRLSGVCSGMTGNSTWIDLPKIYTPKLMPGLSLAEIDRKMIEAAKGIEDWINTNMSAKVSVQWMNLPDPEENPRGMFGWFRIFRDFEDSLKIPTNEQMRVRPTEQVKGGADASPFS